MKIKSFSFVIALAIAIGQFCFLIGGESYGGRNVSYFCYNNHSYICFDEQILHDPDCVCLQRWDGGVQVYEQFYPLALFRRFDYGD